MIIRGLDCKLEAFPSENGSRCAGLQLESAPPEFSKKRSSLFWDMQLHFGTTRLLLYRRNIQLFYHPHQLCQRCGPHLLHDNPALDFNGKFGGASGLRVQRSPATVRRPAYGYPWNRGPTFANQEIEIHTLICLQNVVVKSRYQPRAGGSGNPRSSQNLRWVRPLALNFPTNSAIYIRATPERRTCVGKHRTGRARKPLWI